MTRVTSARGDYLHLPGREYRPHPRAFRCDRNVVGECSLIPTQLCTMRLEFYDLGLNASPILLLSFSLSVLFLTFAYFSTLVALALKSSRE